jgi:hypothetical protein
MNEVRAFMDEIESLVEAVRRAERERCAKIVENWPIYNPYLVKQQQIKDRREAIAAAIRGEDD